MKLQDCERIGKFNRFGNKQIFTCLVLPIVYIHKPIGEWMCSACAWNLLRSRDLIPKLKEALD